MFFGLLEQHCRPQLHLTKPELRWAAHSFSVAHVLGLGHFGHLWAGGLTGQLVFHVCALHLSNICDMTHAAVLSVPSDVT